MDQDRPLGLIHVDLDRRRWWRPWYVLTVRCETARELVDAARVWAGGRR